MKSLQFGLTVGKKIDLEHFTVLEHRLPLGTPGFGFYKFLSYDADKTDDDEDEQSGFVPCKMRK